MLADQLAAVEAALVSHFGQQPARASVSFLGVDPIEVLRFEPVPDERAYVTLGMSRLPMTSVNELVVAAHGPRAELMLQVRAGAGADVWRRLAVLAAAPAVEGVVYRPDMSVDIGEPLAPGSRCTGVVVAESLLAPVVAPDGPVDVFDLSPATSTELAWCRVRGTTALRARWVDQGVDLHDLGRPAARLD
ncbi:suppressor of fused domain protein [uncultured Jatrophihabitans sp.]|uniref:suppressor of fused domain protein n=1 Tax=uncultured Jatrophihabitans sp. TaxID=1610747 RepID=UPI0035CAC33A